MYFYIPLAFVIITAVAIAVFLWRYHRLPVETIIRAAQAETISSELDIEVSTWFGKSKIQFTIKPKSVASSSELAPEAVPIEPPKPMMSSQCDLCQEFMLIEPPRFKDRMRIRESRYSYVNLRHGWVRYEKIPVSAPCDGRVEYPVVTEHDREHWWFRIVTPNDILFTIIMQDGEERQVKPDCTCHIYGFQVLSSTDVDTGDIVMVIAKESPKSAR